MTRPLIVGEAPGPRTDPAVPLDGRAARRIAALAGIDVPTLRRRARIRNILPAWPGPAGKGSEFRHGSSEAVDGAARLVDLEARRGQLVIVLGRRAARALAPTWHGLHRVPFLEVERRLAVRRYASTVEGPPWRYQAIPVRVVVLPHPSGVNHWWNDPANVDAAGSLLREALA